VRYARCFTNDARHGTTFAFTSYGIERRRASPPCAMLRAATAAKGATKRYRARRFIVCYAFTCVAYARAAAVTSYARYHVANGERLRDMRYVAAVRCGRRYRSARARHARSRSATPVCLVCAARHVVAPRGSARRRAVAVRTIAGTRRCTPARHASYGRHASLRVCYVRVCESKQQYVKEKVRRGMRV